MTDLCLCRKDKNIMRRCSNAKTLVEPETRHVGVRSAAVFYYVLWMSQNTVIATTLAGGVTKYSAFASHFVIICPLSRYLVIHRVGTEYRPWRRRVPRGEARCGGSKVVLFLAAAAVLLVVAEAALAARRPPHLRMEAQRTQRVALGQGIQVMHCLDTPHTLHKCTSQMTKFSTKCHNLNLIIHHIHLRTYSIISLVLAMFRTRHKETRIVYAYICKCLWNELYDSTL